jgi:NADH-quinone oxidoreductase subunit N
MNAASPLMEFSLASLAPELVLAVFALLLTGLALLPGLPRKVMPLATALGALLALTMVHTAGSGSDTIMGMLATDGYSRFFKSICLLALLLTVLISERYREAAGLRHGEYYALLLFAVVGMMVMISAIDLIMIFVGMELMALSIYCLVGLLKHDVRANEAAIKYFLMGAFSSAFFLYGLTLVYGVTGTTSLGEIAQRLALPGLTANPALLIGLGMVTMGFAFKIAAAPFHMWTPDVYEGAPTAVTAFMSVAPKAASFAVLGRVLMEGFPMLYELWHPLVATLALLSMAVGNITALAQTNIKRMLAYSSIAHAGYALLGILAGTAEGLSATMNYLLIYALMSLGAFAVIVHLGSRNGRGERLEDYKGLAHTNPMAALAMLLFMFSLTGIPPTAGFIGKFYLLIAVMDAGYPAVALGAVLFSAISAYYYLRLVRYMYMHEVEPAPRLVFSFGVAAALCFSALGVIGMGVVPGTILAWAGQAVLGF